MKKFNYIKWVTENKYGKINEQLNPNITTGSYLDDVMFDTGSGDTPNPYYTCPTGLTQTDTLPCNNNGNWGAPPINGYFDWNGNYDSFVSFCCVTGSEATGSVTGSEATGSVTGSEATGSNYQPFCCDINAMNFGQMANGEPYGMNPGEPEIYLMQNGPQGDMCDNSICQGSVGDPGYGMSQPTQGFEPMAPQPSGIFQRKNLKNKLKRRLNEQVETDNITDINFTNSTNCSGLQFMPNQGGSSNNLAGALNSGTFYAGLLKYTNDNNLNFTDIAFAAGSQNLYSTDAANACVPGLTFANQVNMSGTGGST